MRSKVTAAEKQKTSRNRRNQSLAEENENTLTENWALIDTHNVLDLSVTTRHGVKTFSFFFLFCVLIFFFYTVEES